MDGMNLWSQVLSRIQPKVNPFGFHVWFEATHFISHEGTTLRIAVPNHLFGQWMVDHYSGALDEALAELGSADVTVTYVVDSSLAMAPTPSRHSVERAGRAPGRPI